MAVRSKPAIDGKKAILSLALPDFSTLNIFNSGNARPVNSRKAKKVASKSAPVRSIKTPKKGETKRALHARNRKIAKGNKSHGHGRK